MTCMYVYSLFVGNGQYFFTHDQRMKRFSEPVHDFSFALKCLEHDSVICPVLFVLATNSALTGFVIKALDVIKKWKHVDIKFIEGEHDIHMTDPEKVPAYITEFLMTQRSKI